MTWAQEVLADPARASVEASGMSEEDLATLREAYGPLIAFIVTGFTGHYPVGTAAIVYATNREHCKRVLLKEIRSEGSPLRNTEQDPDHWTISPVTPVPVEPKAVIMLDGNY